MNRLRRHRSALRDHLQLAGVFAVAGLIGVVAATILLLGVIMIARLSYIQSEPAVQAVARLLEQWR